MSKIMEFIDSAKPGQEFYPDVLKNAIAAIPDIKRIVEWVETADHKIHCDTENAHECDYGLWEIQSLIRR